MLCNKKGIGQESCTRTRKALRLLENEKIKGSNSVLKIHLSVLQIQLFQNLKVLVDFEFFIQLPILLLCALLLMNSRSHLACPALH